MTAFFLGPHASYTHSAAMCLSSSEKLVPLPTILKVFEMISDNNVGIVPLENSIFGSVLETVDALALYPELEISCEALIEIDHCLASNRQIPLQDIKKVVSHPQALGQCSLWISERLESVQLVESSSTARAAYDLSLSLNREDVAVICSKDCAKYYNLCILEESIQNSLSNMTRFVKIQLRKVNISIPPKDQIIKTLISFTLNNDQPGALSVALLELNKVQLTRIDSRPNQKKNWAYIFYIEMIGDANDPDLAKILLNLKSITQSFTIHGSFWLVNPQMGEQANKYAIKNYEGADVGFIIEEDSSFLKSIIRQMLLTRRSFNATILDSNGQIIMKIKRPIKWFLNSEISVYDSSDELIGEVKQVWHLWRRQYDLFLGKKQFATIDTGFLGWDFQLKDEKGVHISSVNREFGGFAREIFTDTGSYVIHLQQGGTRRLTLKERAVVLGCAINIDIDYFSRHSGRGGFFPFYFMGGGSDSELTSDSTPQDIPQDILNDSEKDLSDDSEKDLSDDSEKDLKSKSKGERISDSASMWNFESDLSDDSEKDLPDDSEKDLSDDSEKDLPGDSEFLEDDAPEGDNDFW